MSGVGKGGFTFFNRRHHCRGCGALVCGDCSPTTRAIGDDGKPERICKTCEADGTIPAHFHTWE